jgi:hypothetical protein
MSWIWPCMLPFLVSVSVNLFCIPSLLSQTTWWRCTVLLLGNTWGPGLTFWVCFLGKSHNLPMNHSSSLLSYSGNWLVVTPNILWKVLLHSDCSHSISSVLLRLRNKTHTHTHTHPYTKVPFPIVLPPEFQLMVQHLPSDVSYRTTVWNVQWGGSHERDHSIKHETLEEPLHCLHASGGCLPCP